MTQATITLDPPKTAPVPTLAALDAQLAALVPDVRARAEETERQRRTPAETVSALKASGLCRIVQPALFGGLAADFAPVVEAVAKLSAACPSTGWVYGLYAAHQWLIGCFPIEAQWDVWRNNPDAVACGSYAPVGVAEAAPGGWRIGGRWAFASGCDGADWALCATLLPPAGEGRPTPAFLLVPRSDYRIEDTWHVAGLAGTGSKTLVLDNVVVPAHRVLTFEQSTSGQTPGRDAHRDPGLGVPMLTNIPSCLAATAVGAAAGAVEDYLDMCGTRVTRGAVAGGNNKMAEFATIQLRVGQAVAQVDAAREILLRDVRRRAATVRAGAVVSVEERIESRRGQAFAVKLALEAVEALNASTGGQGLALSNPIQRAWRDVNAVARHISLNWDAVGTMTGQLALGLPPRGQF